MNYLLLCRLVNDIFIPPKLTFKCLPIKHQDCRSFLLNTRMYVSVGLQRGPRRTSAKISPLQELGCMVGCGYSNGRKSKGGVVIMVVVIKTRVVLLVVVVGFVVVLMAVGARMVL